MQIEHKHTCGVYACVCMLVCVCVDTGGRHLQTTLDGPESSPSVIDNANAFAFFCVLRFSLPFSHHFPLAIAHVLKKMYFHSMFVLERSAYPHHQLN